MCRAEHFLDRDWSHRLECGDGCDHIGFGRRGRLDALAQLGSGGNGVGTNGGRPSWLPLAFCVQKGPHSVRRTKKILSSNTYSSHDRYRLLHDGADLILLWSLTDCCHVAETR